MCHDLTSSEPGFNPRLSDNIHLAAAYGTLQLGFRWGVISTVTQGEFQVSGKPQRPYSAFPLRSSHSLLPICQLTTRG